MQQYFIEQQLEIGMEFTLENKDDCFHIVKVMRAKRGTQVEIVADRIVYICEIKSTEPVILKCLSRMQRDAELPIQVTIIQGLPKLDKMDVIIQKATELGAQKIIPWEARRSIVKYESKKAKQKHERWRKIAKEAAEQAHRNSVPTIVPIMSLNDILKEVTAYDAILIGSERLAKEKVQQQFLLNQLKRYKNGAKIACVIGPEGGIDDREFDAFLNVGAEETVFGPRILRTETASLYFLSAMSLACE